MNLPLIVTLALCQSQTRKFYWENPPETAFECNGTYNYTLMNTIKSSIFIQKEHKYYIQKRKEIYYYIDIYVILKLHNT